MKKKKVKTSISIDEDLHIGIKELGELENRSFSNQVAMILQEKLDLLNKYKALEQG